MITCTYHGMNSTKLHGVLLKFISPGFFSMKVPVYRLKPLIVSMTNWRHFDGYKDTLSDIQSYVTHSGKRSLIVTIFESGISIKQILS